MIFIDARDGLSGDMLLAGMLALLDGSERDDKARRLEDACLGARLQFRLSEMEASS